MNKWILKNLSNTQRIIVERVNVKGEDRVEIRKEYRKTTGSDWMSSKGITIPVKSIPKLVTILKEISNKEVNENE
ncbi:MAG: hypothetical protein IKB64_02745 [Paludibacteraceae bacterium]|nr:hypothetical protein [Paludibacteraceae bacterium]